MFFMKLLARTVWQNLLNFATDCDTVFTKLDLLHYCPNIYTYNILIYYVSYGSAFCVCDLSLSLLTKEINPIYLYLLIAFYA